LKSPPCAGGSCDKKLDTKSLFFAKKIAITFDLRYLCTKLEIMDAKLTLKINKLTIDKAKHYAVGQNRSLSRIVEDYLTTLTILTSINPDDKGIVISPFVSCNFK
jgi:hypothetical protein